MFNYFKKAAISKRADDELLYEYVLNEIENDIFIKGLWAKALASSAGNNANAKSIYMQYRVQSIKDVFTAQKIAYNDLTKPKLLQYLEEKVLPMTNDYTKLQISMVDTEDYKVTKDEEALYEEVASELANNIRKEGLWLKAIQNTDGNENRALSLYIKYRSESIKDEKAQKAQEDKKARELTQKYNTFGELDLQDFLRNNKMSLIKKLGDRQVLINYMGTPVDAHLVFKDGNWIVSKIIS